MKKRFFLIICIVLLCGCAAEPLDRMSETLGGDVRGGSLVYLTNSHGGFHGDGETVAMVRLENVSAFLEDIQGSPYWHPLPLSGNVSAAVYGCRTEAGGFGPLFPEDMVPRVENGCWFFLDRHSKALDPADDTDLHSRSSWNFTAAIFDADTKTLYYLELDT